MLRISELTPSKEAPEVDEPATELASTLAAATRSAAAEVGSAPADEAGAARAILSGEVPASLPPPPAISSLVALRPDWPPQAVNAKATTRGPSFRSKDFIICPPLHCSTALPPPVLSSMTIILALPSSDCRTARPRHCRKGSPRRRKRFLQASASARKPTKSSVLTVARSRRRDRCLKSPAEIQELSTDSAVDSRATAPPRTEDS